MTLKLNRQEISEKLDITDPFLMIDDFEEIIPGKTARAIKNLQPENWFFNCHMPKSQLMPATLQIECMLQTLVLLIYSAQEHGDNKSFIHDVKVKLFSPVKPENHNITFYATLNSFRRGIAIGEVVGKSNGIKICHGKFSYASPHLFILPKQK